MIRIIAAIDSKNGLANDTGIPWKINADSRYYRQHIKDHHVLMGKGVYDELRGPATSKTNYVASRSVIQNLRSGFVLVNDARQFLTEWQGEDIWNIGGAGLYAATLDLAEELYLTRIDHDFACTKFFPGFQETFQLVSSSPPQSENDISFCFEVWKRLPKQR